MQLDIAMNEREVLTLLGRIAKGRCTRPEQMCGTIMLVAEAISDPAKRLAEPIHRNQVLGGVCSLFKVGQELIQLGFTDVERDQASSAGPCEQPVERDGGLAMRPKHFELFGRDLDQVCSRGSAPFGSRQVSNSGFAV